MTNFKFSLLFSISVGLLLAWGVSALSKDDIVFPVAELGNCQDEKECRVYCNNPQYIGQCVIFAEKYELLSGLEIEKAKKFQSIGAVGPGGCASEKACKAYCEDVGSIKECLLFAEQHGFMEENELKEAKKIAQALQDGAQLPGGCTSKSACEEYCSSSSHMKECILFAERAGFMDEQELREAKQVLKALDAGVSFPGNCKGKNECDAYCEDSNHMEECVNFGIAAGFIHPEEVEQARRMIPLMKSGKMPAECKKGKEQCEAYCGQKENIEVCATFFTEAGFMTQEDAQMFRKTGGKGPGNCKGKEECEAFCNNPENQEACFLFAKEHGLIPEEDLSNMKEGIEQFQEAFSSAPPQVAECLKEKMGQDVLQKIEAGTLMPSQKIGDQMKSCFEKFMPKQEDRSLGEEGHEFSNQNSGQEGCIEGILGDPKGLSGAPSEEQERRIREECFGQENKKFSPRPELNEGFMQEQSGKDFKKEFQQEFDRQFQEHRGRQPVVPQERLQYQEFFQPRQEEMREQIQSQWPIEQIPQQPHEPKEFREEPLPLMPVGGSILDAALYLLMRLL